MIAASKSRLLANMTAVLPCLIIVAAHPGNKGMKAIAEAILQGLGETK